MIPTHEKNIMSEGMLLKTSPNLKKNTSNSYSLNDKRIEDLGSRTYDESTEV